jgi:hypothetical protein
MNIAGLPAALDAGNIAGMTEIILLVSAGFTIGAALLGLLALYQQLGLAALWLAVGGLYVIYAALQRRGAAYFDPGGVFGNGRPALPPPGKQALPPLAAPQIGRSRRPALPGPKK